MKAAARSADVSGYEQGHIVLAPGEATALATRLYRLRGISERRKARGKRDQEDAVRRYMEDRDRLIRGCLGMILHEVRNSGIPAWEHEDAFSECQIALVKAADYYNPRFRTKFITYATTAIQRALHKYARGCGMIRPPRNRTKNPELQKLVDATFAMARDHDPGVMEAVAERGPGRDAQVLEARDYAGWILSRFPERQAMVVRMKYGQGLPHKDIAAVAGVSASRVKQQCHEALAAAKRAAASDKLLYGITG